MAEKAEIILSAVDKTRAAFASAQGGLEKLQASTAAIAVRMGTIGVAIGSAFTGATLKETIDAGDGLSKLAQKSGIAIEKLSELRYAGELSDVSIEALAKGVKTLGNNMAAAAAGNKEQVELFKTLGVSVRDANGNLRSTDDVLGDVADKFAGWNDGAGKAAIASKLFGDKLGTQLIPLLNSGKKGLADSAEEARKLGVIFGSDLGRNMEAFNDNLSRISAAAEAAKIALANQLLPTLNSTAEAFIKNVKNAGLFRGALLTFGQGLSERLGLDDIGQLQANAEATQAAISRTTDSIVRMQEELNRKGGDDALLQGRIDKAREKLTGLQKQAASTSAALKQFADEAYGKAQPEAEAKKSEPPKILDTGASSEAEARLRQQLAGQLKTLERAYAAQEQLQQFHDRVMQQAYDAGLISVTTYYEERTKSAQAALADEQRVLTQEIEAQQKFARAANDPKDREKALADIEDLKQRKADLDTQFARNQVLQSGEQTQAVMRLHDQYENLLATIEQLNGNESGAQMLRVAQQVHQAEQLLAQQPPGTVDSQAAEKLRKLLTDSAELADIRSKVQLTTDALATAEERYQLAADQRGDSLAKRESEIYAIRKNSLDQLQELADKSAKLAAASSNPELKSAAEQIALQFERAAASVDPFVQRFNDATKSLSDGISESFGRAIVEGTKASDLLGDIEKQILSAITRMLVIEPLAQSLANTLKFSSGSSGGAGSLIDKVIGLFGSSSSGGFGTGSDFGNLDLGGFLASGGPASAGTAYVVGEQGPELFVPNTSGYVVPNDALMAGRSSSAPNVTVQQHFAISGPADQRTQSQIAAAAQRGLARGLRNL